LPLHPPAQAGFFIVPSILWMPFLQDARPLD